MGTGPSWPEIASRSTAFNNFNFSSDLAKGIESELMKLSIKQLTGADWAVAQHSSLCQTVDTGRSAVRVRDTISVVFLLRRKPCLKFLFAETLQKHEKKATVAVTVTDGIDPAHIHSAQSSRDAFQVRWESDSSQECICSHEWAIFSSRAVFRCKQKPGFRS